MHLHIYYLIGLVIVTTVSAWITAMVMRRRIRRALGKRDISDAELTSINTWMEVEDAEERRKGGKLS